MVVTKNMVLARRRQAPRSVKEVEFLLKAGASPFVILAKDGPKVCGVGMLNDKLEDLLLLPLPHRTMV